MSEHTPDPVVPLRDTSYAQELVSPVVKRYPGGDEIRLERLWVKGKQEKEIRLSWWKDGNMMLRPADLPEEEFIEMLAEGFRTGVLDQGNLGRLVELVGV